MSRPVRWALRMSAALLLAGLIAPFISVNEARHQLQAGLERALGRRVEVFGDTTLNLFRGPGFSLAKVVIYEDSATGIEPLANVPELQATVSLRSLWTGHLEFASVRFVEPSLNLAKSEKGGWNIAALLQSAGSTEVRRLPAIYVSNGRINFKFGDTRSAFYLTGADFGVYPERNGLAIRFSGAPARTDRPGGGYGLFSGQGRIVGGQIDLDMELEKSPVEDLLTLVRGRTLGLHGEVSSQAKITGPQGNPEIQGRIELFDVHRWDLIQAHGVRWNANYRGRIDMSSQKLEITADGRNNPKTPVSGRLLVSSFLSRPDWQVEVVVNKLPAHVLRQVGQHIGAPLPDDMTLNGDVAGTVAYGSETGVQGQLALTDASVLMQNGPEFQLPRATLLISGDEIRLMPAELSSRGSEARLEATYAPFQQRLEAQISGRALPISDLQNGAGNLFKGAAVPIMDRFRRGTWTGTVRYVSESGVKPSWTIAAQVRDSATTVPGLSEPLRIHAANLETHGDRIEVKQLRASVGDIELLGSYRYVPDVRAPHKFVFSVPEADAPELERIFLPTLQRSNFLARTLRLRTGTPEWLRDRGAEGQLRVGTLRVGEVDLRAIRCRVVWSGAEVHLENFEARMGDGWVRGAATADLSHPEPGYMLRGAVRNFELKSGSFDAEGSIQAAGTGVAVLTGLSAEGKFQTRAVTLAPEYAFRNATGTFDLTATRNGPQVKFANIQASLGAERFTGDGGTQPDGRLLMDLTSGSRTLRVSGSLAAPRLEQITESSAR